MTAGALVCRIRILVIADLWLGWAGKKDAMSHRCRRLKSFQNFLELGLDNKASGLRSYEAGDNLA